MHLTTDSGMQLTQRWASSYKSVAYLYIIIATQIHSISMTVPLLGKLYQYKDNKGTDLSLYGNMHLPPRWASSYDSVACLDIIATKILSISMTVPLLGELYQYKVNKGTDLSLSVWKCKLCLV